MAEVGYSFISSLSLVCFCVVSAGWKQTHIPPCLASGPRDHSLNTWLQRWVKHLGDPDLVNDSSGFIQGNLQRCVLYGSKPSNQYLLCCVDNGLFFQTKFVFHIVC